MEKKPSREIIHKGWDSNSHGAGITWMNKKDRKAHYVKGLTSAEQVYSYVEKLELPFVIHFRLASVGGKDLLLTHPFEITKASDLSLVGESNRVLIHNGHEDDWKKCAVAAGVDIEAITTPMSDTRAMAMILARNKTNNFLKIASGKFVVVGYENEKDEHAVKYWGDFDEEDGMLFSNTHWKWRSIVYPHHSQGHHVGNSVHAAERYNADEQQDWRDDYYNGGTTDTKKAKETLNQAAKEADELINGGAIVFSHEYKEKRRAWWQKKFSSNNSNAGTKYPPANEKPIVYNLDKNEQTADEEENQFLGCGC